MCAVAGHSLLFQRPQRLTAELNLIPCYSVCDVTVMRQDRSVPFKYISNMIPLPSNIVKYFSHLL